MSTLQYIYTGIIVMTTLGSFVEAGGGKSDRLTLGRCLLALVLPLLLIGLVVLPPWESVSGPTVNSRFVRFLLFAFGGIFFFAVIPPLFVFSMLSWVNWALTVDFWDPLRALKRVPHERQSQSETDSDQTVR